MKPARKHNVEVGVSPLSANQHRLLAGSLPRNPPTHRIPHDVPGPHDSLSSGTAIPMKQGEPRVGQPHKVLCYSVVIDGETFHISGADYETILLPGPAA